MPTAQPFTAIARRGSGLVRCLPRVDVDDFHIWTTLGTINKDSGTPTEDQRNESIRISRTRMFDLHYNWHTIKGASTITATDTEEPANNYQRIVTDLIYKGGDDWEGDDIQPKKRVCRVSFKRLKSDPDSGFFVGPATIGTVIHLSDFEAMYLDDEFIGYGLGYIQSANARFAPVGAEAGAGTGNFTSVCIGGYEDADRSAPWTNPSSDYDIAITTLTNTTNSDEYPVICEAVAIGDGTRSADASTLNATATGQNGESISISAASQIDGIESWTY